MQKMEIQAKIHKCNGHSGSFRIKNILVSKSIKHQEQLKNHKSSFEGNSTLHGHI